MEAEFEATHNKISPKLHNEWYVCRVILASLLAGTLWLNVGYLTSSELQAVCTNLATPTGIRNFLQGREGFNEYFCPKIHNPPRKLDTISWIAIQVTWPVMYVIATADWGYYYVLNGGLVKGLRILEY